MRLSAASARIESRSAPSEKIFTSRSSIMRSIYSLPEQERCDRRAEIGHDRVCRLGAATLVRARGMGDQRRPAAGCPAREHLAVGVTDHPRSRQVDPQLACRRKQHSGGGLAAFALPGEFGHDTVGVVMADPEVNKASALELE